MAALEVGGIRFCEQGLAKLHDHLQRQVGTHKVYAEGYLLGTPTVWGGYEPVDLDKSESVKDALIAQGIAYSSDKDSDLLHQADEPAVMSLLQYRHSRRQFEIVQGWQSLALQQCGKRQVNLFPKYSQLEYLSGRLSHSHTGIEQILPVNEEQQVRRLAGLLASRQEGMSLVDVALSEAPIRVLAQVSQDSALLNLYRAGDNAIDRLSESLEIDNQVAWALWIGAEVYGYRNAKKWQQFVYQETGTVLTRDQAKQILSKFWELMEPLKRWHQIKPVPKEWSFTICGRYRYGHRSSHADVMAHRVMGTLSDLVKEAAIEIHQALPPLGGKPYLVIGSRLIWEVPTSRQHKTADLAAQMLMERCRRVLPDVVKEYEAEVLAAVPVRNVLL